MDISPSDSPTSPAKAHGPSEVEQVPDAELDAFLAAERTANDYHP